MKCFQSKIQIPQLGILGPQVGPKYFISTITTQCSLYSNHTRHLTASQYPYQALISFFLQALPGTLFSLFYLHLCPSQNHIHFQSVSQMSRATWGLSRTAGKFEHFLSHFILPQNFVYMSII